MGMLETDMDEMVRQERVNGASPIPRTPKTSASEEAIRERMENEGPLGGEALRKIAMQIISDDQNAMLMRVPGYEPLARVLLLAYNQSARGKGKERHANDKPFEEQPIMRLAEMSGLGGHVYQIMKKAQEAGGMHARGSHEAAIAEFCGVIVYAAAAILHVEKNLSKKSL